MKREIENRRFQVKANDGTVYTIIEYQEMIDGDLPSFKTLVTSNGLHVNYINPEMFKIVETDTVIRRF